MTGEPLLFLTTDGVDINVVNGQTEAAQAIETHCLLALFGGNTVDGDWWGNALAETNDEKYASETQALIESSSPSSGQIQKLERAVVRDLAGLNGINATLDSVDVSIQSPGRAIIAIAITLNSEQYMIEFDRVWKK